MHSGVLFKLDPWLFESWRGNFPAVSSSAPLSQSQPAVVRKTSSSRSSRSAQDCGDFNWFQPQPWVLTGKPSKGADSERMHFFLHLNNMFKNLTFRAYTKCWIHVPALFQAFRFFPAEVDSKIQSIPSNIAENLTSLSLTGVGTARDFGGSHLWMPVWLQIDGFLPIPTQQNLLIMWCQQHTKRRLDMNFRNIVCRVYTVL